MWKPIILLFRSNWEQSWKGIISDSLAHSGVKEKGADQTLLTKHVWFKWGVGDSIHHDSYTCRFFSGSTGWPTQRLNTTDHNFFGAVGKSSEIQK